MSHDPRWYPLRWPGALPLKELEEADGHADRASFSESGDLETNGPAA